jgi:small conductance mechanosensitive channel
MPDEIATIQQVKDTLIDLSIKFGPKLFVAIVMLIAGFYVGRWVGAAFGRSLKKLHLEPPVQLLFVRVVRLLVIALFLVMALQNLGVDLLPLIAGLSVVGAGVALAMQGVLGNLAAGLTIIFTKPFRVGDYIAVAGVDGRVETIELFVTTLSHTDASMVVVPNRKIVGEILHNYGQIRQLDLSVSLSLAADVERALAAADSVVKASALVLKDPAPVIGIARLGGAAITIAIKPWVKVTDYIEAGGTINRAVVEKLKAAGVSYPVPPTSIAAGVASLN